MSVMITEEAALGNRSAYDRQPNGATGARLWNTWRRPLSCNTVLHICDLSLATRYIQNHSETVLLIVSKLNFKYDINNEVHDVEIIQWFRFPFELKRNFSLYPSPVLYHVCSFD